MVLNVFWLRIVWVWIQLSITGGIKAHAHEILIAGPTLLTGTEMLPGMSGGGGGLMGAAMATAGGGMSIAATKRAAGLMTCRPSMKYANLQSRLRWSLWQTLLWNRNWFKWCALVIFWYYSCLYVDDTTRMLTVSQSSSTGCVTSQDSHKAYSWARGDGVLKRVYATE